MPLVQTRGAASAQGFGEFAQVTAVNYIEDVFSTYLYNGTGASQTITNGIDLSGKGGLTWIKIRDAADSHILTDTVRGVNSQLKTNTTGAAQAEGNRITSFTSTGFVLGVNTDVNQGGAAPVRTYASWSWAKAPKFFDVVTYTGDSVFDRVISHNLSAVPAVIIIKCTSSATDWVVRTTVIDGSMDLLYLNLTNAKTDSSVSNTWSSSTFTVGAAASDNQTGQTYVAYLFASNAGGFGLTGTDNVISCGSFTTDGSGNATVNLGYEPQWILTKQSSGTGGWSIVDSMRGNATLNGANNTEQVLRANSSNAEFSSYGYANPTSTGFVAFGWGASETLIYIAIRRGPMKVPTVGTSVFAPLARNTNGTNTKITTALTTVDMVMYGDRNGVFGTNSVIIDRLRGYTKILVTSSTGVEGTEATAMTGFDVQTGYGLGVDTNGYGTNYPGGYPIINWQFGRAPSFFDEVCYTGTGSATTFNHNLTVVPELMIVKCRSSALPASRTAHWEVYSATAGPTKFGVLNLNINWETYGPLWDNTAPTSSVFTVGTWGAVNASGETYVAYLFATCAGVSKVGSYTGTGALQTINCGFTSGARFVLIRRFGTSSGTGDWYVWDSVRGITSGNDPYLLLNDTAAEVTGTNYVDTDSTGFKVTAAAPAELNNNGSTFIFLAIA